tara:strand:- start:420 stop:653 length:234 start_codon:yes stop_codon:yes gene_type:complete
VTFEHPGNGYQESITNFAILWCLVFGSLYFAYKGIWRHFVLSLVIGLFTFGVSWFIYPFFAKNIIATQYRKNGWLEI